MCIAYLSCSFIELGYEHLLKNYTLAEIMAYVKREELNALDEESYKYYLENIQKSHQIEPEYQHPQISMEHLHQAMQSTFNPGSLVHNFQLPLSPRQMSTLMMKTNHLSRNLSFNEIPAHLPRNLALDMDLVHLSNDRHEDLVRNIDLNLARGLVNELELQNLPQNLVQGLTEHDLRNLDLGQHLRSGSSLEVDLSNHISRQVEQEIFHQDNIRKTPMQLPLEQNLGLQLEPGLSVNMQRIEPNVVKSLHNNPMTENQHFTPMPFQIKMEQEDDVYYYSNMNHGVEQDSNRINDHLQTPVEENHQNPANLHQETQMFYNHQNSLQTVPALNAIDLYARQNYPENYLTNTRDNPENLVMNRIEHSQYTEEQIKKIQLNIDKAENKEPKENLKPQNKNLTYEFQNVQFQQKSVVNHNQKLTNSIEVKGEYVCCKCNDTYPSKRGLKQHMRLCLESVDEDRGKFSCNQCSYKCQSPAILKIHERTHTGEKPFSCSFCDYKSGQKNNVAKHILVHMKEKPFKCSYCEYSCAQKNNLVVHERTHTGYKPFACPYCDYRTVQKPNLVKHMYLHTDQKPFACDQCSYRCVQKTNLTKHKQRHVKEVNGEKIEVKPQSKPYRPRNKSVKCPECDYSCVQKSSLEKHMQFKHSGENTFDNKEVYLEGLNLMKNDISESAVQNLSVRKDLLLENND